VLLTGSAESEIVISRYEIAIIYLDPWLLQAFFTIMNGRMKALA